MVRTLLFAIIALLLHRSAAAAAQEIRQERALPAAHADQGVAADGVNVYAIDNNVITRIRLSDGAVTGEWSGDAALFPHINSCTVVAEQLVCAASNYPALPQLSTVEIFDIAALRHVRSISLGAMPGSLTVVDRHDGAWWATFANYDDRGTPAGRNHRDTFVAKLDDEWRITRMWGLPESVLERLAPSSISGASWGGNGILWLSGHDRPEVYAVALPDAGPLLRHVGTYPIASRGQAIDIDPVDPGRIWSIDRKARMIHAGRLPEGVGCHGEVKPSQQC